jgi:hypothetical protein
MNIRMMMPENRLIRAQPSDFRAAGTVPYRSAGVQQRARCHGIAGIHSNVGNVESVTYRIYRVRLGSNPTLSAIFFAFGSVDGRAGGFQGIKQPAARVAIRLESHLGTPPIDPLFSPT